MDNDRADSNGAGLSSRTAEPGRDTPVRVERAAQLPYHEWYAKKRSIDLSCALIIAIFLVDAWFQWNGKHFEISSLLYTIAVSPFGGTLIAGIRARFKI